MMQRSPSLRHFSEGGEPPLTIKMLRASRSAHSIADSAVSSRLIGLFADKRLYAGALGCFYLIFETLENQLERCAEKDERLNAYLEFARVMYRTEAFRRDLQYYFGCMTWDQEIRRRSFFPAVQAYLDHIVQIADTKPFLLIAHSYTQHIAVASGGQIICKLLRKGLDLNVDDMKGRSAFTYYDPSDTNRILNPSRLKQEFKDNLDHLESKFSDEEISLLIEEHKQVFKFNLAVVKDYHVGLLNPLIALYKFGRQSKMVVFIASASLIAAVGVYIWGWRYVSSNNSRIVD